MAERYTEVEEQEATRIEKALIVGLVGFLLLGGAWVLSAISAQLPLPVLQRFNDPYEPSAYTSQPESTSRPIYDELGMGPLQNEVQKISEDVAKKQSALANATARRDKAQKTYEYRREEYRTAMEAGRASANVKNRFEEARASFDKANDDVNAAKIAVDQASRVLAGPQQRLRTMERRAQEVYATRRRQHDVVEFSLHFGFAAASLGGAWLIWQSGRRRRWRYQSILTATFVASVIQLFCLALFHSWEFIQYEFTLLGISLVGVGVCVLAIIALKRWLFSPERLAHLRLAARRCPHCTTPFDPSQEFCWDCGHPLKEVCVACGAERLRFAPYCGHCGAGMPQPPGSTGENPKHISVPG